MSGKTKTLLVGGIALTLIILAAVAFHRDPVLVERPSTFADITDRDLAEIVKAPDAHRGRAVVLYGSVAQFDSVTGPGAFLAVVGAEGPGMTGALLHADTHVLGEVVQGDSFHAHVVCDGAESYTTQIGGQSTVARFLVFDISRY